MTQRVTPQPLKIELARFLSGCLARHAPLAAERHVTLTRVDAEGTAWLDCAMIGRVLDSLITNAIRHAPEGGRVTLIAERQKASLVIFVADNGAGVAPELTGKLFEPFVTGRADGTGLGLAIARELMDAHDGRLELRCAGGDRG